MQVDTDFSCRFGNSSVCVCVCRHCLLQRHLLWVSTCQPALCSSPALASLTAKISDGWVCVCFILFFTWTVKCWEIYNISLLAFCQLWLNNNKNLQNVKIVCSSGCHEYISSLNKVLGSYVCFFRAFHTKTISSSQLAKKKRRKKRNWFTVTECYFNFH